jgi:hypothetical protein
MSRKYSENSLMSRNGKQQRCECAVFGFYKYDTGNVTVHSFSDKNCFFMKRRVRTTFLCIFDKFISCLAFLQKLTLGCFL